MQNLHVDQLHSTPDIHIGTPFTGSSKSNRYDSPMFYTKQISHINTQSAINTHSVSLYITQNLLLLRLEVVSLFPTD
jgi:hypothetical protein